VGRLLLYLSCQNHCIFRTTNSDVDIIADFDILQKQVILNSQHIRGTAAYASSVMHFLQSAKNSSLKFKVIPFVMESTGFFHKKSLDFLRTIADIADEVKGITNENILICFKHRLSCTLVKIIAHIILTRTAKISERIGLYEERGFNPQVMMEDGM
jgi:hypothetical protein